MRETADSPRARRSSRPTPNVHTRRASSLHPVRSWSDVARPGLLDAVAWPSETPQGRRRHAPAGDRGSASPTGATFRTVGRATIGHSIRWGPRAMVMVSRRSARMRPRVGPAPHRAGPLPSPAACAIPQRGRRGDSRRPPVTNPRRGPGLRSLPRVEGVLLPLPAALVIHRLSDESAGRLRVVELVPDGLKVGRLPLSLERPERIGDDLFRSLKLVVEPIKIVIPRDGSVGDLLGVVFGQERLLRGLSLLESGS